MLGIQPILTAVNLKEEPLATIAKIHDVISPLQGAFSPVISTTSSMSSRCQSTFTSCHQKQTFKSYDINKIIKILSKSYILRNNYEIETLVNFFEAFQILSPEIDRLIAKDTFRNFIRETKYKFINKNDYIFKKNDEGNEFYFILKGEAEIFDHAQKEQCVLNYGHIFGETAMFDNTKRKTYCKSIGSHGIDLAFWDKKTYDKYITPFEQIPIDKYKQFDRESLWQQENQDESKINMNQRMRKLKNDSDAYNVWIAGCDPEDDSFAYFSTLYPILCEIILEKTGCKQIPLKDLELILLKYGAKKTQLSDIHYPDTRNYQVIVSTETFCKFFKWFKATFSIIKELSFLCDLGCNLFCSKERCETILNKQPCGTFILRLSNSASSVMLSYRTDKNSKKKYKHIEIVRKKDNLYRVRKNKKSELMCIAKMIRSFVKVKYLYTPKYICVKKSIF